MASPATTTSGQTGPDASANNLALMTAWNNVRKAQSALEDGHDADVSKSVLGLANSLQTSASPDAAVAWKTQFDTLNTNYEKARTALHAAIEAMEKQIKAAAKKDEDALQSAYEKMVAQLKASLAQEESQKAQVEKTLDALENLVERVGKRREKA